MFPSTAQATWVLKVPEFKIRVLSEEDQSPVIQLMQDFLNPRSRFSISTASTVRPMRINGSVLQDTGKIRNPTEIVSNLSYGRD